MMTNIQEESNKLIALVLDEVESVRVDSEFRLKKSLVKFGGLNNQSADDIANYFFGRNPDVKELTQKLLEQLNLLK